MLLTSVSQLDFTTPWFMTPWFFTNGIRQRVPYQRNQTKDCFTIGVRPRTLLPGILGFYYKFTNCDFRKTLDLLERWKSRICLKFNVCWNDSWWNYSQIPIWTIGVWQRTSLLTESDQVPPTDEEDLNRRRVHMAHFQSGSFLIELVSNCVQFSLCSFPTTSRIRNDKR